MRTAANLVAPVVAGFDVGRVREEFPALNKLAHGKALVYLDNAATTQKPQFVIDAITHFYQEDCSNIHRGVDMLSERATKAYEDARLAVQQFINAADPAEVIFVRGTTEAINLVAHSYGRTHVQAGDAVFISAMEHHSNIVPWQILCEERGARLRVVPMNSRGELLLDEYEKLLTPRTKLVAVSHVSMPWALSIRYGRSSQWRTSTAPWFWWMALKQFLTPKWTCKSWTVISMPSPGTRCSGRRASASCTARSGCWTPCLPIRAGAT